MQVFCNLYQNSQMRILLFLCVLGLQMAQAQTLIQQVTVVDVVRKRLIPDQDVLIGQGKILAMGKHNQVKKPAQTEVVNAQGKFLMPGLMDAHVHFFQSGGMFARPDAIDLRKYQPYAKELSFVHQEFNTIRSLYLASGITSVADVGASYAFLKQRDSSANLRGKTQVWMTGPLLTTWLPPVYKDLNEESPFVLMTAEDQAQQLVQEQVARGADFIKIWYIAQGPNPEAAAKSFYPRVQAAIREAHRLGKRVAVHATELATATLAVEAGADFLVHSVEDLPVTDAFIQLLLNKKVVLCPTLVVASNYRRALGDRYTFTKEELNTAHPFIINTVIDYPWPDTSLGKRYIRALKASPIIDHADTIAQLNLKKLLQAGVPIATGTDAGNIGTQHVSSYAHELKAMQDAGFSIWNLLESSTLQVAKAMGQEQTLGSIQVGKQADLLLLTQDPSADFRHWFKPERVMVKGQWYQADTLVKKSPAWLAQQQLNAYNAHDVEAFLEPYADSVQIYDTKGNRMINGKEEMRKQYQFIKQVPGLYCKLLNRIVSGNTVVDHEEISMNARPNKPQYGVAMYTIRDGKIVTVVFGD